MRRDEFLKAMAAMAAVGAVPVTARAAANIKMMIPANPGGGWDTTGRAALVLVRDAVGDLRFLHRLAESAARRVPSAAGVRGDHHLQVLAGARHAGQGRGRAERHEGLQKFAALHLVSSFLGTV